MHILGKFACMLLANLHAYFLRICMHVFSKFSQAPLKELFILFFSGVQGVFEGFQGDGGHERGVPAHRGDAAQRVGGRRADFKIINNLIINY